MSHKIIRASALSFLVHRLKIIGTLCACILQLVSSGEQGATQPLLVPVAKSFSYTRWNWEPYVALLCAMGVIGLVYKYCMPERQKGVSLLQVWRAYYKNYIVPLPRAVGKTLDDQLTYTYQISLSDGACAGRIILLKDQNIVKASADAIVNAANEGCLGGDGIDGVIHTAAGPRLKAFNGRLPKEQGACCPRGDARISPSFDLYDTSGKKIKFIISTTGPQGGNEDREQKIRSCYRSCIELVESWNFQTLFGIVSNNSAWQANMQLFASQASEFVAQAKKDGTFLDINTIIFPPISAGLYFYPLAESAPFVVPAVVEAMKVYASKLNSFKAARSAEVSQESSRADLPGSLQPLTVMLTLFEQDQDSMGIYAGQLGKIQGVKRVNEPSKPAE